MERERKNKIFLLNFFTIIYTYGIYIFNNHYSEDSFEAMRDIGALANTNLRNGRIIHYFLYKFLNLINFNILNHQKIIQLVLTLVISIGISVLAIEFCGLFYDNQIWTIIGVDVILLFLVVNPSFCSGWYYWPETCLGASLSMAVTFVAIWNWCKKDNSKKNLMLSFIFLFLSVSMYQVYVEVYVGICLAYSLVKNKFKISKSAIADYLIIVIYGGGASVLSILGMSFVQKIGLTYVDERTATSSIDVIINNIKEISKQQVHIWFNMNGLMVSGLMILMIIIPLIIVVINYKKTKNVYLVANVIYVGGVILTIYVLAFTPNIVSGLVWLAPRTYIGIFVIPIICMLWALMVCKKKKWIVLIVTIMLFVMSIRIQQIECNTIASNKMDFNEIDTVTYLIENYENETGIHVDTICYRYDDERAYSYKEIKYQAYDNNVRGMAYSWCFENMLKYLWREDISITYMSDEEYSAYFNSDSWNVFQPTKQLYIKNNVAYFVIY